ncbi:MAG: DNA-formamidopyrimidine glycosylase family protein [Myxococcaceae bacterium]
MPEGDTLHNLATTLSPLLGQRIVRLEFPRGHANGAGLIGETVERIEARGKNLLISFSGGSTLHVHLKMTGVVHLYEDGQPWRRGASQAVAILGVKGHEAVCFKAPLVRLLKPGRVETDRQLRALGPDLHGPDFETGEALRRLRELDSLEFGVAVMTQSAVAGIGNVYKSELLFNRRLDPFATVSTLTDAQLAEFLAHARSVMQQNLIGSALKARASRVTRTGRDRLRNPLSVYGRLGEPCFDCGTLIRMQRQGEQQRSTYFCPSCQRCSER